MTERDHGKTTFAGYVDEPSKVTVNGNPAQVMSTDGGAPFRFEALVDLDAGANTVVVQATDGQNNVATKTYAVTTTGDSKKYEYDGNGNLRYEKQSNGTVLKEYRWDQQNRLVRVLEGSHESVYEYDGESHRTWIKELTSSSETKNETFIWCGSRICQKRASNGSTVLRNYFNEGFEESGTTDYFYTRDHLGSVREVVGSDGSTVASRLAYDPWGKITETGSGALTDFGYTGHHFDRPSELSLALFRGYSPLLGRWMSRDPMGLAGGLNLYGYVNNEPIDFLDPSGYGPLDFAKCLLGGKGLGACIDEEKDRFDNGPLGGGGGSGSGGGGSGGSGGSGGGYRDPGDPDFSPCKNAKGYSGKIQCCRDACGFNPSPNKCVDPSSRPAQCFARCRASVGF